MLRAISGFSRANDRVLGEHSAPPKPMEGEWQGQLRHVHRGLRVSRQMLLPKLMLGGSWLAFTFYSCALVVMLACVTWGVGVLVWEEAATLNFFLWTLCRITTGDGDVFFSAEDVRRVTSEHDGDRVSHPVFYLWYGTGVLSVVVQATLTAFLFTRLIRPGMALDFSAWAVISATGVGARPSLSVRMSLPAATALVNFQFKMRATVRSKVKATGRVEIRGFFLPLLSSEILRAEPGVLSIVHPLTADSPFAQLIPRDPDGEGVLLAPTAEWAALNVSVRLSISCMDSITGLPLVRIADYPAERIIFGKWLDVISVDRGVITTDHSKMHCVLPYEEPHPVLELEEDSGSVAGSPLQSPLEPPLTTGASPRAASGTLQQPSSSGPLRQRDQGPMRRRSVGSHAPLDPAPLSLPESASSPVHARRKHRAGGSMLSPPRGHSMPLWA